jgi:hypothetical protein
MSHYSLNEWADYIRGVTPEEERRQLQRHLESGCEKCRKLEGIWRAALKLAQKEINYQPPDRGVQFVKSLFVVVSPGGKLSPAAKLAQPIFDSFRQPLPAGVRSTQGSPRHLVYRSGAFLVDVRLEAAYQGSPARLAGQILDHANPGRAMKDVSISLRSGPQEIASVTTNQFGEFRLELGLIARTDLHLAVWTDPSGPIVIPLSGINPGGRPS